MSNDFGIEPAFLIFLFALGSLLAFALLGTICALIGAMLGKFALWIIRGDVDRIRL